MQRPSPDEIVTQLRAELERATLQRTKDTAKWLEVAAIAVPAVLRAGAAGNVTCHEAAVEILKLLNRK